MIQLSGLKRQFGSRVLFEGLSWTIPDGARIGLVGPNGSGKTTLLRLLDGSEAPDAGAVHRSPSLQVGYLPQEVETVHGGSVLSIVLSGFAEVAALERQIEQLGRELEGAVPDDPRTGKLTERYGELRARVEQLEGDRLEAKAKAILSGLGVPLGRFHEPVETLSGGWRMRIVLARLLLGAPGLLLLDEPTNHLDLEAIDWLEEFLSTYEGAFVVVSHDRYFLNRMARDIVELDRGCLTAYAGNYERYVEARQTRQAALEQQAKQQAKEIQRIERFIERFRYKNTKARQVQARIRALGKVERIETARATRKIRFGFPPVVRAGDIVVRAEGLQKSYGDHTVYRGLDLLLRRGDRVALVGPNGCGKSTLLKLIAGRVPADGGTLRLGHNVHVAYYAQHQLDELDAGATVLEELERAAPGHERVWARNLLGRFLFAGDEIDKPVAVLSGGEKARLALVKLLSQPSNLLLLDEPTNHLDLGSREVLEDALNEYGGSLVVISHDRYFINRIATSVGRVDADRVEIVPGDFDEFTAWTRRRADEVRREAPAADGASPATERKEARRREAEARNRMYRKRREQQQQLGPIEDEITELERRAAELEACQADAAVYRDPQRAAQVGRDKAQTEARLEGLYLRWEELARDLPGD